jgi:hypothetical protein
MSVESEAIEAAARFYLGPQSWPWMSLDAKHNARAWAEKLLSAAVDAAASAALLQIRKEKA